MKEHLAHIISQCFVNVPFAEFDKYSDLISAYQINPEIGLDGNAVYDFSEQEFTEKKKFLDDKGLQCTLHAPFHDMLPGARDRKVLEATRAKLHRCFKLIGIYFQ